MAYLRKRPKSSNWVACFFGMEGERIQRSTGTTNRKEALRISAALLRAQAMLEQGERNSAVIIEAVRQGMAPLPVDYVSLVDARTMRPLEWVSGEILLAVAVNMGRARLIDNIKFTAPAVH